MAACRRLAAGLRDPQKVAAFQRLCGVEGPCGWPEAEQRAGGRGPVANGGPAGRAAGNSGGPRGWRRRPRRNSLSGEEEEEGGCQEFATRSRLLYYLFSLGTELGNELFYILFFPCCIWNVDAWLGRRLVIVWVWVMYVGQCTKDVVRWPRPASPPVVKLEVFYSSEYSMPSTHAMSGTAIPLALLLLSYGRWQVPAGTPHTHTLGCLHPLGGGYGKGWVGVKCEIPAPCLRTITASFSWHHSGPKSSCNISQQFHYFNVSAVFRSSSGVSVL